MDLKAEESIKIKWFHADFTFSILQIWLNFGLKTIKMIIWIHLSKFKLLNNVKFPISLSFFIQMNICVTVFVILL